MSNDLISRSAVIAIIENKRLRAGKHNLALGYVLADVQEKIEKLNAAYDVDKVVEQLEEKIENTVDTQIGISARMAFGKAIEIVKAGGVNE